MKKPAPKGAAKVFLHNKYIVMKTNIQLQKDPGCCGGDTDCCGTVTDWGCC
jgi:hypothetical protein